MYCALPAWNTFFSLLFPDLLTLTPQSSVPGPPPQTFPRALPCASRVLRTPLPPAWHWRELAVSQTRSLFRARDWYSVLEMLCGGGQDRTFSEPVHPPARRVFKWSQGYRVLLWEHRAVGRIGAVDLIWTHHGSPFLRKQYVFSGNRNCVAVFGENRVPGGGKCRIGGLQEGYLAPLLWFSCV